jgi:hypothetical protein
MTLQEMIADLPQQCSLGAKKNSQGHPHLSQRYPNRINCLEGAVISLWDSGT